MQRRALLSSLAGGTVLLAGCADSSSSSDPVEVYNPTGTATVRSFDEPIMQHGLTTGSGQYLYARVFHPGETLPVTDHPDADRFAEGVAELSTDEFAVFTNLRTTPAAPAYFWPADAEWGDERVEITLEREAGSYDGSGDEAVGVALTSYDYDGETPTDVDIIFPSGATISVGQGE